MASTTFVIIGASLAGAKGAEALREAGYSDRIVLIGDETEVPYERPPLSKQYLQGKQELEKAFVHPAEWYGDHDIDLRLGTTAAAIDRDGRSVTLADGTRVAYDALLLATGSSPRRLPVPGGNLEGVHYLRRIPDCEQIKATLRTASRVVFVGGGWIGLEVTAAAREAGIEAVVLEADELPLGRVLGPEIARVFADMHRQHGVDLRPGSHVTEILSEGGRASGVLLADGTRIGADAVVVGIGAAPNIGLAEAAGLTIDNGVRVDASLRSSDPHVFAAGDVANAFHPLLGKHIRVEHWDNARKQPAVAARAMLGEEAVYDRVPYFFTDQYDLGMEYSGYIEPGGYDDVVVRGDLEGREFLAFWLADGRVKAGMNVNIWDVNKQIQQLVQTGGRVDAAKLADADTPLDQVAAS
ncbi:NAD(P)/FAD-dependent oxidoreductase [Actinospica robiniae]|uniref:NAD(P)/FAD-dependent oxidoreductase n=1 Tax=Actinospica robiniae TaxID=304901 RepID=UPI0004153861|nr:FAD-dependent oxidoreductase [Actinospica robiniae]